MSKDLTYTNREPAFLQRLKAGFTAQDGRNNVQHARSGKSRLKTGDDEDDGPVVLDERGEIVEKGVWEDMVKGDGNRADGEDDAKARKAEAESNVGKAEDGEHHGESKSKQKVVEVGAAKKRKAGKVVGGKGDSDRGSGDEKEDEERTEQSKSSTNAASSRTSKDGKSTDKSKKKAKKIKLSFDDPE